MRCRCDRHHGSGVSAIPYSLHIRRVSTAFARRYSTDRGADCNNRLVQQVSKCRTSRIGTVFWDVGPGLVIAGGNRGIQTPLLRRQVVETGAQEGRQWRALLDDQQAPKSAAAGSHPEQVQAMSMTIACFGSDWPHVSFRSSCPQAPITQWTTQAKWRSMHRPAHSEVVHVRKSPRWRCRYIH